MKENKETNLFDAIINDPMSALLAGAMLLGSVALFDNDDESEELCDCVDECEFNGKEDDEDYTDTVDKYYDELSENEQSIVNKIVDDFVNLKEIDMEDELTEDNRNFLTNLLREFAAFTMKG